MAKTETPINNFKINYGTYQKIQENLSQIGENEIIITSDKNIPIPTANDAGKVPTVDSNGDFILGTPLGGGVSFTFETSGSVQDNLLTCSNFSMTNAEIFQAIEDGEFIYGISTGVVRAEWILSSYTKDLGAVADADFITIVQDAGTYEVSIHSSGLTFEITSTSLRGQDGIDGVPGHDGQDGQDGHDGVGVPIGGTTGQVLAKASGTDYDTEWITPSSGGGVPTPSTEDLVLMSGVQGGYSWTQTAKPIYLDDLSLGVDPSTFEIIGVYIHFGGSISFSDYMTATSQSLDAHYDVQLLAQIPYGNDTLIAGAVFHVENINVTQSSGGVVGDIIFKCSSLDQSGLITLINTMVPDKFPADTTDLLIKWKREFDSDTQDYVESFEWVPVCNQSKVIVSLGSQSLMAFNNIITSFMTEAVPNKLGQFVYAKTSDTFTEYSDILAYLSAGKEVWIDLGSSFDNTKLLINKYTSTGFGFTLNVPHYTITGVGDTYSSVEAEVYSSTIHVQGFVQLHST